MVHKALYDWAKNPSPLVTIYHTAVTTPCYPILPQWFIKPGCTTLVDGALRVPALRIQPRWPLVGHKVILEVVPASMVCHHAWGPSLYGKNTPQRLQPDQPGHLGKDFPFQHITERRCANWYGVVNLYFHY